MLHEKEITKTLLASSVTPTQLSSEQTKAIEEALKEAKDLLELNEYKAAASLYKQVLQLDAYNLRALTGRGVIFEFKKDFGKAKRNYEKAINKNEKTTDEIGLKIANTKLVALKKLMMALGLQDSKEVETSEAKIIFDDKNLGINTTVNHGKEIALSVQKIDLLVLPNQESVNNLIDHIKATDKVIDDPVTSVRTPRSKLDKQLQDLDKLMTDLELKTTKDTKNNAINAQLKDENTEIKTIVDNSQQQKTLLAEEKADVYIVQNASSLIQKNELQHLAFQQNDKVTKNDEEQNTLLTDIQSLSVSDNVNPPNNNYSVQPIIGETITGNQLEVSSTSLAPTTTKYNLTEQAENEIFKVQQSIQAHALEITGLCLFTNAHVVSSSKDKMLKVWDVASGQCLHTLTGHTDVITGIAKLSNNRVISSSADNTLKVWDMSSGECVKTLSGHQGKVRCVAILSNNQVISGSDDYELKVWDLASGECIKTLIGHVGEIRSVAVLADDIVISGAEDGDLKLWEISTGQCIQSMWVGGDDVTSIAVMPNGHVVTTSSKDKKLKIWDLSSGKFQESASSEAHTGSIKSVAALPDGYVISSSTDKTLKIWDLNVSKCYKTLEVHKADVTSIAVLSDGCMITGSKDGILSIWKYSQLKLVFGEQQIISPVDSIKDIKINRLDGAINISKRFTDAYKTLSMRLKKVLRQIRKNTILHLPDFHESVTVEQFKIIIDALKYNHSVIEITLNGIGITDAGLSLLADLIKENKHIKHLAIESNWLSKDNKFEYKKSDLALTGYSLNCSQDEQTHTKRGIEVLVNALKENRSIRYLSFENMYYLPNKFFAELIYYNKSISEINFKNTKVSENGFIVFTDSLAENSSLEKIILGDNHIDNKQAQVIVRALINNKRLTMLDLGNPKHINDQGAFSIAELIEKNNTLTHFNIGENDFTEKGLLLIIKTLAYNQSLKSLHLKAERFNNDCLNFLRKSLKNNHTLQEINIDGFYAGYCKIDDEGAIIIARMLQENTSLTSLTIENCSISDIGAEALAGSIKTNTSLTFLNLAGNKIHSKGAGALGQALKSNTKLEIINLSNNEFIETIIDTTSMIRTTTFKLLVPKTFFKALKGNCTLNGIVMSYANMYEGNRSVRALSHLLKYNVLNILDLKASNVDDKGVKYIAKALIDNSSLIYLDLASNGITTRGAKKLAAAIKKNRSLVNITFSDNQIDDEGIASITEALKENNSLTILNIDQNAYTNLGFRAIKELLQSNRSLTQLSLSAHYIINKTSISEDLVKEIDNLLRRNKDLVNKLYASIYFGKVKKVQALFDQKVSLLATCPDFKSDNSPTPLHWAIRSNRREVVKVILDNMLMHNIPFYIYKDDNQKTALDLAKESGVKLINELVEKAYADLINKKNNSSESSQVPLVPTSNPMPLPLRFFTPITKPTNNTEPVMKLDEANLEKDATESKKLSRNN